MCAVVFVSTDSEQCLKAWNNQSEMEGGLGGVHMPLMSDCNHAISRDYGVLIEGEGVSQRALFVIDPKGIVRNITVNDADVGRSVDETLRVVDALAFKDAFGEGCPADWKKGDTGVKVPTKSEGPVELKKPWSEWARPRLQRAWSGASQRSMGGASARSFNGIVTTAAPSPTMERTLAGLFSPNMLSPTSNAEGYMERNMEAAMANHAIDVTN